MVTQADLPLIGQITANSIAGAKLGADGAQRDKDAALRKFLQQGDLENDRLIADANREENSRHNREMERIGSQQANTTEGYRKDQATKMQEEARAAKLKLLFTGGTGEPKMSMEAQKNSNLVDTARESLNNTETLLEEHPIAGTFQTGLQAIPVIGDGISNMAAGLLGGNLKKIRDSKASTKEAMQNLYTGAAASGEQVPAFQGFSGPGALDIARGNIKGTTDTTRDALNTFQKRAGAATPRLNQEMLDVSGLGQDPIGTTVLRQQQEAMQAAREAKIQKMDPQDRTLYSEIMANPGHPNAVRAKKDLERKYGSF